MTTDPKTVALVLAVLSCVFCSGYAQDPVSCSQAPSISFNQTAFFTVWYEATRQPTVASLRCVQVTAKLLADNTTLNLDIIYSNSSSSGYQDQEQTTNVTLNSSNTAGYSITYVKNGVSGTPVFTKLLSTYQTIDGVSWLAGCGYNDPANPQNVFGFLLANNQNFNATGLQFVTKAASQSFSVFTGTNVTAINQSGCYRNSAASAVPILSGVFAVVYVLLRACHLA